MALYTEFDHTTVTRKGNGADGSITFLNYSGGSGQYEFAIGCCFPETVWQDSPVFTGLTVGGYQNLVIRDKNNPLDTYTAHNGFILRRSPTLLANGDGINNSLGQGEYSTWIAGGFYGGFWFIDIDDIKYAGAGLFIKNDNTLWYCNYRYETFTPTGGFIKYTHPVIGDNWYGFRIISDKLYNIYSHATYGKRSDVGEPFRYIGNPPLNKDKWDNSMCILSEWDTLIYTTFDIENGVEIHKLGGNGGKLDVSDLPEGVTVESLAGSMLIYAGQYCYVACSDGNIYGNIAGSFVEGGGGGYNLPPFKLASTPTDLDSKKRQTGFNTSVGWRIKNDGTLQWRSSTPLTVSAETDWISLKSSNYQGFLKKVGNSKKYYAINGSVNGGSSAPYYIGEFEAMHHTEYYGWSFWYEIESIVNSAINLTATNITYTTADFSWELGTNSEYITKQDVQINDGSEWITLDVVGSGDTTYNSTGLTPNTNYEFRILTYDNDLSFIESQPTTFQTLDPAPFNLQATEVGIIYTNITWELPDPYGTGIEIRIREVQGINKASWITKGTVSNTDTSYTITGLLPYTNYECYVVLIGSEYPSNTITFQTIPLTSSSSFCENPDYTIQTSSCGNSDGSIIINDLDYTFLYDFELTDVDGTSYPITGNTFGYLPSNYYFLKAVVKPEYWYHFGRDECYIEWIRVEDDDTDITLNQILIKPSQCGGFDTQLGRITYVLSTGNYLVKFYNENKELKASTTGTTNISYIGTGCRYGVIEDTVSGCKYLVDQRCIPLEDMRSISGVKKLFIAKNNDLLDINYWSSADDDFYLESEDVAFFLSTKIKDIVTSLTWYSVPVHNGQISLSQKLEKQRQGFVFTDVLNISIAQQTATKLNDLLMLYDNKWVFVIQDANNQWWIGGYKLPSELKVTNMVTGRRNETNEYRLEIQSISLDNILTAIDENYIYTNILS